MGQLPAARVVAVLACFLTLRESRHFAGGFVLQPPPGRLQQQQQQQQQQRQRQQSIYFLSASHSLHYRRRRHARASLDGTQHEAASPGVSHVGGFTPAKEACQQYSSTARFSAAPSNSHIEDATGATGISERLHGSVGAGGQGSRTAVSASASGTIAAAADDTATSTRTAATTTASAAATQGSNEVKSVGVTNNDKNGEERQQADMIDVATAVGQNSSVGGVSDDEGSPEQGASAAAGAGELIRGEEERGVLGAGGVMTSEASSIAAVATVMSPLESGIEVETAAPWSEFEDWLLQDTYPRYVIGSGKHVLWQRMVREVPELMERSPQEARQRWLRLTGRLDIQGEQLPGSPPLDSFYLQPPVLEEWEEVVERNGVGYFRGNVFGQRGLADGTAMTTAPVDVAGRRIQDQYVATQCGVVYELGEQRQTGLVGQAQSKLSKYGPVTGLALATAFYALTVLSHHVQVEVFVI